MRTTFEMSNGFVASNIATMEQQFQPGLPSESVLWSNETRMQHLLSLPTIGFTPEQHTETIDQIVAIGFPVNNFTSVHRRPNIGREENNLGSWGYGSANYGEFSVYDLIDTVIPEERLGVIAHESMHANTPLEARNAALYGGESERQDAERHVYAVTEQSLVTGVHLDGYHKWLIQEYKANKIDYETLAEETSAIMAEMAITNRNGLEEVQTRQVRALEDINRIRNLRGEVPHTPVPLLSYETRWGTVLAGVDKTLVKLLAGVNDFASLVAHTRNLKAMLYAPANFAVVESREAYRNIITAESLVPPAIAAYLQSLIDNDDPLNLKKKKRKKDSVDA